ncbi:14901_t:CDS:2, partial [Gigaspora rosea]
FVKKLQKVFVEYEGVGITNPRLYKMDKELLSLLEKVTSEQPTYSSIAFKAQNSRSSISIRLDKSVAMPILIQ